MKCCDVCENKTNPSNLKSYYIDGELVLDVCPKCRLLENERRKSEQHNKQLLESLKQ